ncbi:MAG: sugar phosphate isomerase/epimerase [Clostridia bacterium]|nr:sugar phosphate isomerase/epimerase [Clostridia bacterium]
MNIGIRLHDTAEGTLAQRLSYAKAQGFSCAHLALSKALKGFSMKDAPSLLTEELAASVKHDFASQQMDCAVLGCYLTLTDPNEEDRQKTHAIYRAHLKFSRMMDAGVVGTETPAPKGMDPHTEEAFQLFIRCLKPIVRWAEEENAVIAIEPVCDHIVSTPEKAERMLNLLPSENLRIILDSVNLLSAEAAKDPDALIAEAIRRLGEKVSVLHMKDYLPVQPGDIRAQSIACGQGIMDYKRLLTFAKQKNLPMTLEDTVPENAQAAREYLERIAQSL